MCALYEPVELSLGTLPEKNDDVKTYQLQAPAEVKEVLVYAFVTTHGEGEFHRGYYEFSTNLKGKKFKQYLNVATGQGVNTVNSANMWFPVGEGKLSVKLVHSEGEKSVAAKSDPQKNWSEVFVIGQRS